MKRCPDPREAALKHIVTFTGSAYDSANDALGAHRADADETTRTNAVELAIRRTERLCRDVIASIARLPR